MSIGSRLLFTILFVSAIDICSAQQKIVLKSPDGTLAVEFSLDVQGKAKYTITKNDEVIVEPSSLGIVREDEDFTTNLSLGHSATSSFSTAYVMATGKKNLYTNKGYKRIFPLKNKNQKPMNIIFQVTDDGVAFRYHFPDQSGEVKKISAETTSFNFPEKTKAWLQPMSVAKSGWNSTNPSYEEYYHKEIVAGVPAPTSAGWVYPALFHTENYWALITESSLDRNYCGTRLKQESKDGEYQVGFPDVKEGFPNGNVFPESTLPWFTPWRVIAIGSLATIVESTLGTDLAKEADKFDASFIKPGIAAWSWVLLKDDSTVYDVQKRFIDYAADMNWRYVLVDADWDKKIGYEKIRELADYGKTKNVGLILWYNSAGSWNTVEYTPKDKLVTSASREAEFLKLQQMGIKGLKIDFFGGDGQSMIRYYLDILEDAKRFGMLINFHGATLPRGWQRTYPNLMTMESIKGMEFITFEQRNADEEPAHATTIPFTRNVFDPMDFTPMALHEIPGIKRKTTSSFELATSVVFLSGIQHMAETPRGMKQMPPFVKDFLRRLPAQWDNVKFIDGYPGKLVVIARHAGDRWIVAGLNGEAKEKTLSLDLSFIKSAKGIVIADSPDQKIIQQEIVPGKKTDLMLQPNGGFVIEFQD